MSISMFFFEYNKIKWKKEGFLFWQKDVFQLGVAKNSSAF